MQIVKYFIDAVIQACPSDQKQGCENHVADCDQELQKYAGKLPSYLHGIFFLQLVVPRLRTQLSQQDGSSEQLLVAQLLLEASLECYLVVFLRAMEQACSNYPSIVVDVNLGFLLDLQSKEQRVITVTEAKCHCDGLFSVRVVDNLPLFKNPHRYEDPLNDVFVPAFAKKLREFPLDPQVLAAVMKCG